MYKKLKKCIVHLAKNISTLKNAIFERSFIVASIRSDNITFPQNIEIISVISCTLISEPVAFELYVTAIVIRYRF
jgi:hypothetical protein